MRGQIPFWNFGGDAVVTDDYLRLTPAEKSRSGYVFNAKVFLVDDIIIIISLLFLKIGC